MRLTFLSTKLILGFALSSGGLLAASCSEQLPKALDAVAAPPTPSVPWGLDTRPVSATCIAREKPPPPAAPLARIAFESLTSAKLNNLVEIVAQSGRLYVIDQRGVVYTLSDDKTTTSTVLDLSSKVNFGYDSGLLSMAFHPKFAQNGFVYLAMTVPHPTQPPPAGFVFQSVLARYHSNDGGLTIDPSSEKRLLVRDQPTVNHHGNKILFGPDGYLYFAVGDGGGPVANPYAQDPNALYGKLLRLDVDGGDPYAIPPTNPYALGGGAPEVYALGFRNPWRFSFDSKTGDLWLGDVGQSSWEEIDRVVLGGNYGHPIREGKTCLLAPGCDTTGLIDPVVVHPASEAIAIIGGYVYRGTKLPELYGKYVYTDYASSIFWALPTDVSAPVPEKLNVGLPHIGPSSFGVDAEGELLVVSHAGKAYRIVPAPTPAPEMPAKLSETGCVDASDPTKPAAGVFPYDVVIPQWMDGTSADRFLSIPEGTAIAVGERGRLELPAGSVAMRTLRAEGKRLETQLLLRRPDGAWSAHTYAWSSDQKDATLAEGPSTIVLPSGRAHAIEPDRCTSCHSERTLVTIGLEAGQLDRGDVDYGGGRRGNPLATLAHVGMLAGAIAPGTYDLLPSTSGTDTVERRVRAYFHGNCAYCHDGRDGVDMDLRFSTPFRATRTCGVPGASPAGGALRLAPGDPEASQIFTSLRTTGAGRMPPSGTRVPDEASLRILREWIGATTCAP